MISIIVSFLWIYLVDHFVPQSGLQGKPLPCASADPQPHHLWWLFVATPVGPTLHIWVFPTPLLPGFKSWPFVWPRDQWAPLESAPFFCPISVQPKVFEIAYFGLSAYLGTNSCCFSLTHVPWVCTNLNPPLV